MNQNLTTDELRDELVKYEKWATEMIKLLGIKREKGRLVSWNGEVLPSTKLDAIKQEAVRSHELIRVRQAIWGTDLPDEYKIRLVTFLNLVAEFVKKITRGERNEETLVSFAERVAMYLGSVCNVPEE